MTDTETYLEKVERGLALSGKPLADVTVSDLAPADQFHVGGAEAIARLIPALGASSSMRVLDIGAGLGGPARMLAEQSGCQVTGIDLNELSVNAGNRMSEWTGLAKQVRLLEGTATDLPCPSNHFDLAWTVHVGMFVADKAGMYQEAFRVLKPGARLSIFDPFPTASASLTYPVPWARTETLDHSIPVDDMIARLSDAGFVDIETIERTAETKAWFAARKAAAEASQQDGPPPLGLHLLVGPEFSKMVANAGQAVMSGGIDLIEVHASKPK
ncbi:class I SAM-dependent methyltransferase [Roseobacteraceae bacterium S113]